MLNVFKLAKDNSFNKPGLTVVDRTKKGFETTNLKNFFIIQVDCIKLGIC